jgi:hypothetical protein
MLGIHRTLLYKKMKKLSLPLRPPPQSDAASRPEI